MDELQRNKAIAELIVQQEGIIDELFEMAVKEYLAQGRGALFGLYIPQNYASMDGENFISSGELELRYLPMGKILNSPVDNKEQLLRKVMTYSPEAQAIAYIGIQASSHESFYAIQLVIGEDKEFELLVEDRPPLPEDNNETGKT